MLRASICLLCLVLALPAQAADQSYKVFLGGTELGWFRFSGTANNARIASIFNNTPLGVFNGGYEGESRVQSGQTVYRGKSNASSKTRDVEIRLTAGTVTETTIAPEKDRTGYSDPATLPAGLLDPVAAFSQFLLQKNACPPAFKLYDGRRVVQVTPKSADLVGAVRTCVMDYQVVLGKGHLSPLGIKHLTVTVTFDPSVAKTGPSQLSLQTGPFGVMFQRD